MDLSIKGSNDSINFLTKESNVVSLETEMSEKLYISMKDFVLNNPTWDQYQLINSALATFLVQNGCSDRSVTELYINQLFNPTKVS